MGPLAFAHQGQAEGVHDVAEMIALGCHPFEHRGLGCGRAEVGEGAELFDEFGEQLRCFRLPALLDVFFRIGLRGLEEEFRLVPELGHEVDTALDEADDAGYVVVAEIVGVHAVGFQHRAEEAGQFGIGSGLDVFVVEPAALVEGKLGA